VEGNIYRAGTMNNPPIPRRNKRGGKMCRLVIIEYGMRLKKMRNGYVKKNQ